MHHSAPCELRSPGLDPKPVRQLKSLDNMTVSSMLVAQSCPTLCNPMDCSSPGSSIHGILQARILEWVAIPFSRASSQIRDWSWVSCIAGRFFSIWATRELPGKSRGSGTVLKTLIYYQGWNKSPVQVGCMRQVLRAGALGKPRGMGWEGRWEGGLQDGEHM